MVVKSPIHHEPVLSLSKGRTPPLLFPQKREPIHLPTLRPPHKHHVLPINEPIPHLLKRRQLRRLKLHQLLIIIQIRTRKIRPQQRLPRLIRNRT